MNIDGDTDVLRERYARLVASMEPSMNIDGDLDGGAREARVRLASMEPSMNIDGDRPCCWPVTCAKTRFNGAVDEHRRRR